LRYQLRLERQAERQLRALPVPTLRRIDTALRELAEKPRPAAVRKLRGKHGDGWRLRVGDYRLLYTIDDAEGVVTVYRIDLRERVYRRPR